jgi:carboxyl-terminal processing protease
MNANRPQKEEDGLEVTYRIPVERFQYADELNEENRALKIKNAFLIAGLITAAVISFVFGWGFGSFKPIPLFNAIRQGVNAATTANSEKKIENVTRIMENYWYFSRDIDRLNERLVDQALIGMTTNEEDPHTEYMTREEIIEFTQAINRNFVGIGVQFKSTEDAPHVITRVFRDSPAEKAGVQAGDIIHLVEGVNVDKMNADEIRELVQGEEGTKVAITFLRDGEPVTLNITRGQVYHTVDGKVIGDGIGYLALEQFGESTGIEVKEFLDQFRDENVTKLIIDLRDDGGGYLDALKSVLSSFLPADTVVLRREYTDGKTEETRTSGGLYPFIDGIVLLVNDNTASASEAFTLAMRECRQDVTVIGKTTYGKGSVQVTRYFDDGSAIKYTDSIWKSPGGVWVNGTGITPDETVELHPVLEISYIAMTDEDVCARDTVSEFAKVAQLCLDFLGYEGLRSDGYFDEATETALKKFQKEAELEEDGILTRAVYDMLISQVAYEWASDDANDSQYNRAIEVLKQYQGKSGSVSAIDPEGDAIAEAEDGLMIEAADVRLISLRGMYGQI